MSHIKSLPFVDESSHAHALDRTDAGELIDPDTYNPQSHLSLPTYPHPHLESQKPKHPSTTSEPTL